MGDEQDPVSRGDPQHRNETDERAERDDPAGGGGHEHATDEGQRQADHHEPGHPQRAEVREQDEEDPEQGKRPDGQQRPLRLAPCSVLAQGLRVVPRGELVFGERAFDGARDGAEVGVRREGDGDVQLSRATLVRDRVAHGPDADLRDVSEPDRACPVQVDQQVADRAHVVSDLGWAPDDHIDRLLPSHDRAEPFTLHERGCALTNHPGVDSERGAPIESRYDLDLRYEDLSGWTRVLHAVDGLDARGNLGALGLKRVEVRPVETHHDGAGPSAEHLAHPLLQVRLHVAVDARVAVHDVLYLVKGAIEVRVGIDADPELCEVGAHHLVGDLRAADVGAEVPNARHREELGSSPLGRARHRLERRAWLSDPVHEEVVFGEVGEERFFERAERAHGHGQSQEHRRDHPLGAREGVAEPAPVRIAQARSERRLAFTTDVTRQEHQREHGGERQGHGHRGEHREPVAHRERAKELSGHAGEEEHGDEHQDHDHRGEDDGAAHFERSVEDDQQDRLRTLGAGLAQATMDVLDVDDRVVHDLAQRDDEPRDHHRVERSAEERQNGCRRQERDGDRDDADDGRTPIPEKEEEDDDDEGGSDRHRLGEVRERPLDEPRGAEHRGVELDPAHGRAQLLERRVDPVRDVQRVRARLLLDDEEEPGAPGDHGLADRWWMVLDDLRHVPEGERAIRGGRHRHAREVFGRVDEGRVQDRQPLVRTVDEAAGLRCDGLLRGHAHLVERDARGLQTIGIDADLELSVAFSPDRHVRDARDTHEPRPYDPTDQVRQLHLVHLVRPHRDLEDTRRGGER